MELDTEIRSSMSPLPQKMTVRGRLVVRSEGSDSVRTVVAQLRDVEVLDPRGRVLDESRVFARDLELPFGMTTERGVAKEFVHDSGATENAFGVTGHLLAALQLSGDKLMHAGVEDEWDPTGLAKVDYVRAADGSFEWKKLSYERVVAEQRGTHADARRKVAPTIRAATGRLEFDGDGLRILTRREEVSVALAENAAIDTRVLLSLRQDDAAQDGPPLPSWSEHRARGRVTPVGSTFTWEGTSRVDDLKRGDFTLDTIFQVLDAPEKGSTDPTSMESAQRRAAAVHALVGFLRQDGRAVERVIQELGRNTPAEARLLDALGQASTPETLDVLVTAVRSKKLSDERRAAAAAAMIRAQWPTRAAFEALKELLGTERLREHGLLGIGTFVRRWREGRERPLMLEGVEVLRRQLGTAASARHLVAALLGIANSGAPELYDSVLPHQESPKKDVRDAAIQAIRLMKEPRVEPRLAGLLLASRAEDIRSALHALRPREATGEELVARVKSLAATHTDADVRREAVLVLKHWSGSHPELRESLEQLKSQEREPQVLRAFE